MTALAASRTTPGATALRDRALGPDLARGLMLWFIALANSHYFLDAPERPADHRRLLGIAAVVGIAAGVLGAQPVSLVLAHVQPVPGDDAFGLAQALHSATGMLAGAGYAAAITLFAMRVSDSPGRVVRALAAAGQRSLTCYLAQSVVWAVVFTPFLLGLAGDLTVTTTALLATATWLATVAAANALARSGRRGPFEVLVRRVTYR